jgi:F-type H+-transporting ATPase subunit b
MKSFYFAFCIALTVYATQSFGAEAGMPQLNPEFWAAQIFWLLLIFSMLYIVIWKIFLPKITNSIENRKSKVVNDLNEAGKLKERAENKLKEYDEIIEQSKKEAKKIFQESVKELAQNIEKKKDKFNDEIEKEIEIVEKEILKLRHSSLESVSKIATETSAELIKKIINTEVNNSNVSAIVNEISKKKLGKSI